MKNKYQRMNKEEKKETILKYKKTDLGKANMHRLYRILIFGIFALAYGIYQIIIIISDFKIYTLIASLIYILFGLVFTISFYKLRIKYLNTFAIKNK